VVDTIYRLFEAFDHRQLVSIVYVTDYVLDVIFCDQDGSHKRHKINRRHKNESCHGN